MQKLESLLSKVGKNIVLVIEGDNRYEFHLFDSFEPLMYLVNSDLDDYWDYVAEYGMDSLDVRYRILINPKVDS